MSNLAFCIHGHFYQPPRENPLTGEIPIEAGAAPYRNWNERIYDHCYRPNAELGNFERISFNIGPTLLEWMAHEHADTLNTIIRQDQANVARFGVGNAMAQSYHHTILPLSSREDQKTQVLWGMEEFRLHFGRVPQGMWLPETAANDETLGVLAECGIQFTILAPWQADSDTLDCTHPYQVDLPEGRAITVFFYHQDLSTRVSFDPGATANADRFALEAVLPRYRMVKGRGVEPQLLMIASDGELYGHHQPFRDQFLKYLLDGALKAYPVEETYPARWLNEHPVKEKMKIRQNTSWSCHHGVGRWMESCGCTGDSPWKTPLRQGLTRLAQAIDEVYLDHAAGSGIDPYAARNGFIRVMLKEQSVEAFLFGEMKRMAKDREISRLEALLWAQMERQRMFTSCGWFFDDFDRIEPRNNVCYAAQAVWLTKRASGVDLTDIAMNALAGVVSVRTGLRADQVFERQFIRCQRMNEER